MGNDISPDIIRGFVTEYPLTIDHLWTGQSTFTNASTQPSTPEANGNYDLGLTATGTFENAVDINIYTQKAGHIGTAGFVFKDLTSDYLGRNAANLLARWNSTVPGPASNDVYTLLDSLGLENGEALFLAELNNSTSKTRSLIVFKKAVDGTITDTTIYTQTSTSAPLLGGMTRLSDGSILVAHLKCSTTIAQIQTQRSFDGSNFYMVSSRTLEGDIDISGTFGAAATGHQLQKIRLAECQSSILMVIGARAHNTSLSSTDVIMQYVSNDNGGNFFSVGTTSGVHAYFQPELLSINNVFYLIFIDGIDSARIMPLESAVTPIDNSLAFSATSTITGETVAGGMTDRYFTIGQMSAWKDEDDRIWVVFLEANDQKRFWIQQSDNLKDFYLLGTDTSGSSTLKSSFYNIDDNSSRPTTIAGCSARGTQHLFHNYTTATSSFDGGIHCLELGGWSSVNAPYLTPYPTDRNFGKYDYTWVAYDTPDATAHYTKTGTGSLTITNTHALFSTGATNPVYCFTPGFTTGISDGVIIQTRLRPISNGSLTSGRGITIQSLDRKASVYVTTTSVSIYDEYGSTSLFTKNVGTTLNGIEFLISFASNKIKAWYRSTNNIGYPFEKGWLLIGESGTLTAGSTVANWSIDFGHLDPLSGPTMETAWYSFHYAFGDSIGSQILTQRNPEDLTPRKYPPRGKTCYVREGTRISTYDSPGYEGETYTIKKDSQYPLRRIFHAVSPTPRVMYRSATQASGNIPEMELAFHWDTTVQNNAVTDIGNDSYAVHLNNINFRSFEIFRYDVATTAWISEGTFNNAINAVALNFERNGSSVICTSVTISEYIHYGECTNWTWIVTSGGNTYARRIKSNTEGMLGIAYGATKRAVFQLEGVENTDPTTGSGYLVPDVCTAIIHKTGNDGSAIKIKVNAQQNAEKYFQIGSMVVGPLLVTQQYGRGRTISFESGALTTEAQDGTERAREAHKGRRNIRIAWTEGIDISSLFNSPSVSPDYYTATTASGAERIAIPADTPSSILGLARYNNGAKKPIVYLPRITRSEFTTKLLNRRSNQMLCTIDGDITIENVLGDENTGNQKGEVMRVATLTLKEII